MQIPKSITGMVRIRVESADPAQLLSAFNRVGVRLYNVTYINELAVELTIHAADLPSATSIVEKRGEQIVDRGRKGLLFAIRKVTSRPVLIAGLLLLLVLSVFLPSRILFVEVEGNREVPERLIIEHAAQAGIQFGASRSAVRSEKLKNTLLGELPQLQWAGVNTRGCVAVITVTERDPEPVDNDSAPISHVIATRDGVIRSITASSGTPLCQIGQAVEKGQVLVSGYTDCGIAIKAQRAEAEIFAQTNRFMRTITPTSYSHRGDILARTQKYRIILGKKQINLWKDSGISDATCVKMYKEWYLTLPGGFVLPVGIGVEYCTTYDASVLETADVTNSVWLEKWSEDYLLSHMVCGQIINRKISVAHENGVQQLSANYDCVEIIGSNRDEELINNYGEER